MCREPSAPTRKKRRKRVKSRAMQLLEVPEENPLSNVANLFDVAMIFAVALLLAVVAALNLPELLFAKEEITIVKNPGKEEMEIIRKRGVKLEKYRLTGQDAGGEGKRLGICYRLKNGDVIYVPEKPNSQREE